MSNAWRASSLYNPHPPPQAAPQSTMFFQSVPTDLLAALLGPSDNIPVTRRGIVPRYACVISRLREHMRLMAAWGLLRAIPLDIAARRDNTPVDCYSNTKRPMEEAGQWPVLRVAHKLGWMARRRLAGRHRDRHRDSHRVPSMAPRTAQARSRCRFVGRQTHGGTRDLRTHARHPTHALLPRLRRAAPPTQRCFPPTSAWFS
jgi:hypothetical protein